MAAPTITSVAGVPALPLRTGVLTALTLVGTGLGTLVPGVVCTGCAVSAVGAATSTGATMSVQPGSRAEAKLTVQPNWLVTNKVCTTRVATLTTGTHSMIVGGTVVVSGVGAPFDGTWVITAVGATTISYLTPVGTVDVTTVASGGNILDKTGVTTQLSLSTDGYAYANPSSVAAVGSRPIDSVSETTHFKENPLFDPLTEGLPGVNRGQADQYSPLDGTAAPSAATNPVAALNARSQESNLSGPGLGDYVQPISVGPFQVSTKVLGPPNAVNVAMLTFKEAAHPFQVGDVIVVAGVDATFNGTYTVTAVTATTVSYAKVNANIASTGATGTVTGTFADRPRQLISASV